VETGVAHGGSLIFYASLFEAIGKGHVVGVDIEIRPHNRSAIEAHALSKRISLIEGDSVSDQTIEKVRSAVRPGATVLVVLDSNHTRSHVLAELERYSQFVSVGSYIVATDGIMGQLAGAPRSAPDWTWNNPLSATKDFLATRSDFVEEEPRWLFNEGLVRDRVTHWPSAYLKRVK
jgi:cephalosporin hydroxylase